MRMVAAWPSGAGRHPATGRWRGGVSVPREREPRRHRHRVEVPARLDEELGRGGMGAVARRSSSWSCCRGQPLSRWYRENASTSMPRAGSQCRIATPLWIGAGVLAGQLETRAHGARYGTNQVFGAVLEASVVVVKKPHGDRVASVQPSMLLTEMRQDNTAFFLSSAFGYRGFRASGRALTSRCRPCTSAMRSPRGSGPIPRGSVT